MLFESGPRNPETLKFNLYYSHELRKSTQGRCDPKEHGLRCSWIPFKYYQFHLANKKQFQDVRNIPCQPSLPITLLFLLLLRDEESRKQSVKSQFQNNYEIFLNSIIEICKQFGTDCSVKYVAFMSCTRYHPPKGVRKDDEAQFTVPQIMSFVRGHAALGGGRLALFGTGIFFSLIVFVLVSFA